MSTKPPNKRTHVDKSTRSESVESETIAVQPPSKKRLSVPGTAKGGHEEALASEDVDNDGDEPNSILRSVVASKGKGKGKTTDSLVASAGMSHAAEPTGVRMRRRKFSVDEKNFILAKWEELGDWDRVAEAVRENCAGRADISGLQVHKAHLKWKTGLGLRNTTYSRAHKITWTIEEYKFIVDERFKQQDSPNWAKIATAYHTVLPDKESVVANNLSSVFSRIHKGQVHNIPEELQKRAQSCVLHREQRRAAKTKADGIHDRVDNRVYGDNDEACPTSSLSPPPSCSELDEEDDNSEGEMDDDFGDGLGDLEKLSTAIEDSDVLELVNQQEDSSTSQPATSSSTAIGHGRPWDI